jgi:hypothetical protein
VDRNTLLDDDVVFENINEYYTTPTATQIDDDAESMLRLIQIQK